MSPAPVPEPAPFAATLRAVRGRLGLSQAEVAGRAGLTPSYLSMLESRRKPPPSDAVVRRLARALELEPAFLLELAHLERTPEDIRASVERLRLSLEREREVTRKVLRGPWLEALWHFLARRGFADSSLETLRLSRKARRLVREFAREAEQAPSPEAFRARTSGALETVEQDVRDELIDALPAFALTAPATGAPATAPVRTRLEGESDRGSLPVPPSLWTPRVFFLRAPDQDMYPRIQEGDLLLLDPDGEPRNGDVVAVRLPDRETLRSWLEMPGGVELSATNSSLPPLRPAPPGEAGASVVAVARLLVRSLGGIR